MEINPLWSSPNLQFRNNQKSNSRPEDSAQPSKNNTVIFQLIGPDPDGPNFTSISVVEIREIARRSFDMGHIDHDTFSTLYEGLPMQAIDPSGRVIDFSGITATTPFNFQAFYQDQLHIATSLGDPRAAKVLESVVAFLTSGPARQVKTAEKPSAR